MNPSNQTQTPTPEQLPSIPSPFLQNSFQLSFYLPQSNPNPSTNSTSNPSSNLNHYLSLSVPRKRRRGRPRSATSTLQPQTQVFNIPSFSNATINANNEFGSSSSSHAFATPNAKLNATSTGAVPDISDEIIVINKEATSEALIALSSGFPADSLTDEEIDAGVVRSIGGIEQVNYILIRNHIITKWRENVTNWVDKEMFIDVIPPHYGTLLDSAYMFLVSHGYINFGVAPGIKEKVPSEPCKPRVVIIGAGLAGLAAARQLMAFGFKVTVLEGRKRAGGRVYTKKMEGGNRSAAADLGGSVLTGTLGNPLGILARQLSYPLHKVRDKCPLYCMDGKPVDPDTDMKVEAAFNRLLDKAGRIRQLMGEVSVDVSLGAALETFWQVYGDAVKEDEMNLFNWHLANLEYANAGLLSKLSLAFWDQDDPYDMGGDHCFLPGGNGRLVQALAENVPILYERTVHTIRYGSDGVQVIAGSQGFEADMALCTVPLGVLKGGSVKFIPELPQRKLDGIKRLGFGLLNKVAMLFPHVFWGTDLDTFGHLTEDSSRRGEFFLFYSYVTLAGGPLLIALVAGEAAHKFETMPPTDAVAQVLQILRGIYEPQGIDVPEPIQTVCTRWGSDPFSLGSYSNVAVGASGDDYDILAESVGDGRVFFAGEATTRRYPATMHGAFLSGLREAANMAHYANVRTSKMKLERTPSKNAHSCASLLADLFREPDLEFGSFSVIFGKKSPDTKSTAILRVAFSGARSKSTDGSKPDQQYSNKLLFQQLQSHFNQQQELHVYTLLSRQQALELREVRGGDDMRLNHLCEKLGVKLVCRKGLGPAADSVIASVKAERGNRKPSSASLALKSGISKRKTSTLKQKMVRRAKVVSNQLVPRAKIAAGGDVSTSIAHTSGGMGPPPNGNMDRPPIPNMGQPPSVSMGPPSSLNRFLPPTADTGQPADANMGSLPDTKTIQPMVIGTLQPPHISVVQHLDVNMDQPPNTNLGFPQPPVANMGRTPDLSMCSTPEMNMGSTSNANISSLSVGNASSVLEANISSPMHTNMGSTAGVNMCSTPYINMGSTLDANVGSNSTPVLNMVPDSDANIDPPLEEKMDIHPNINMCPPLNVNANTGPILTTNSVPSADVSLVPFPEWNMALSTEWNMPSPTEWNMAPPCEWNLAPSSEWNITSSNSNLLSTHMLNVAPPNLDGMCPSTIEGPSSTVVGLEPPFEWPSNPNQLPSDMVNPVNSNLDVTLTPPLTIVEGPFSSTDVVLPSTANMMNEKMTEDK